MSAKDIPENGTVELVPCSICGRKFAADRIQTHASICGNHKERKVFNPAVQRVKGTDAEEMLKTGDLLIPPLRILCYVQSILHQHSVLKYLHNHVRLQYIHVGIKVAVTKPAELCAWITLRMNWRL